MLYYNKTKKNPKFNKRSKRTKIALDQLMALIDYDEDYDEDYDYDEDNIFIDNFNIWMEYTLYCNCPYCTYYDNNWFNYYDNMPELETIDDMRGLETIDDNYDDMPELETIDDNFIFDNNFVFDTISECSTNEGDLTVD
jgi:hypothetical protein